MGRTNGRRRAAVLVGAIVMAVGFASAALAVKTFVAGKTFVQQDTSFQRGYVAGALDMLLALEDAGFIAPARQKEAKRAAACAATKQIDEAVVRLSGNLERAPEGLSDNAASVLYATMRRRCR